MRQACVFALFPVLHLRIRFQAVPYVMKAYFTDVATLESKGVVRAAAYATFSVHKSASFHLRFGEIHALQVVSSFPYS